MTPERCVVFGYSGGQDATAAIAGLAARHGAAVVAVTIDIGQGRGLASVQERALAAGASRCHVLDAADEFVRSYVLPALHASAFAPDAHPPVDDLHLPLVAAKLVELARIERAAAIVHGGVLSEGGSTVGLGGLVRALAPAMPVHALARGAGTSRTAVTHWGRVVERETADPSWPPESVYTLTRVPRPEAAAHVDVAFEAGVPLSVNGVPMTPAELLECLATIGGAHGIGRLPVVARRAGARVWRVAHEAPAAVLLSAAHRVLAHAVTPEPQREAARGAAAAYAELVARPEWFTPRRTVVEASVAAVEARVTGTVRLALSRGAAAVTGCRSPFAVYDRAPATAAERHEAAAAPAVSA